MGKSRGNMGVDLVFHAVVSSLIHQQDTPTCAHTGLALEYVAFPKMNKLVKRRSQ